MESFDSLRMPTVQYDVRPSPRSEPAPKVKRASWAYHAAITVSATLLTLLLLVTGGVQFLLLGFCWAPWRPISWLLGKVTQYRNKKDAQLVAHLIDRPAEVRQFLTRIAFQVGRLTYAKDLGVATILDGWLHFEGLASCFSVPLSLVEPSYRNHSFGRSIRRAIGDLSLRPVRSTSYDDHFGFLLEWDVVVCTDGHRRTIALRAFPNEDATSLAREIIRFRDGSAREGIAVLPLASPFDRKTAWFATLRRFLLAALPLAVVAAFFTAFGVVAAFLILVLSFLLNRWVHELSKRRHEPFHADATRKILSVPELNRELG